MCTFTQSTHIKCGSHSLKAKVTFTERRYEKCIDGIPLTLTQEPEITIKCLICGRETTASQFAVNTQLIERIFQ